MFRLTITIYSWTTETTINKLFERDISLFNLNALKPSVNFIYHLLKYYGTLNFTNTVYYGFHTILKTKSDYFSKNN
jgi:hypothetical protein